MLRLLSPIFVWIGGKLIGLVVRHRQEDLSRPVRRYRSRRRDRLIPIQLCDETREWLTEVEYPREPGKYVVVLTPTMMPPLTRQVIEASDPPAWAQLIAARLSNVEAELSDLASLLKAEEQGKLVANFEYLVDFAAGFSHTLILIHAGQVDHRRFANVLEEIELQTSQLLSSLHSRQIELHQRCLTRIDREAVSSEAFSKALHSYLSLRRKSYLGIHIRCICGYLRGSLPRAHKHFVHRQLTRIRLEYRRDVRQEREVLKTAKRLQSKKRTPKRSGWTAWFRLPASSNGNLVKLPVELPDMIAALTEARATTDALLRNPVKISKQIKRHVSERFSIVLDINKEHEITQAWRLDRSRGRIRDSKNSIQAASESEDKSQPVPESNPTPSLPEESALEHQPQTLNAC